MNDERKPKQDPIGHATIPPVLRPFLGKTTATVEPENQKNPAVEAAFAQIKDELGDDVQEIDPGVGVGNTSAYLGPAVIPGRAKGRAFTAKVKIIEGHADHRPPAPANDAAKVERKSPWAGTPAAVAPAAVAPAAVAPAAVALPSSPAPPISLPEGEQEQEQEQGKQGRSRGRAIAVAIGALGVIVAVGVWIVARGPREVGSTPEPAARGTASGAPAVLPSGAAPAVVGPAPSSAPAKMDAGASLSPSAVPAVPQVPAPYKGKGGAVKREEPYDAAGPAPVKTAEAAVVPPPAVVPTVAPTAPPKPPVPVSPFDKPNYD